MTSKRIHLIVGQNRHALTLDFVEYILTALGYGFRRRGIADSEKGVARCTAVKILTDSLDKILR